MQSLRAKMNGGEEMICLDVQLIEANRILAEDRGLLGIAQISNAEFEGIKNLSIAGSQFADGPVASKHQAVSAKCFDRDINIGLQI